MPNSVEVRSPRREELSEVVELLCAAFGESPRERFRRQIFEDSTFALDQIRLAFMDGKMVSHVWVAERPVRYGDASSGSAQGVVLGMGGIGGVGTHPDYRKRGLATLLLKDAIAYMERKGYDISMLFTGINDFYARLGWVDFPEHRYRIRIRRLPEDGCKASGLQGYKVREFQEADLEQVIEIYNEHNACRTLTHVRPPQFWRDGHPKWLGLKVSHIVESDGKVFAYACASANEQGVNVREVGYRLTRPQALIPLACEIARIAKAEGREGIVTGNAPRHHPFHELLAQLTDSTVNHEITEHMQLRVINLRQLLEKAQPVLERNLKACGYMSKTSIRISTTGQAAGLKISDCRLRIAEDDDAELNLELAPRLFFKLFLGDGTAWQLRELLKAQGIYLTDEQTALLAALFPPQETVYWGADHF